MLRVGVGVAGEARRECLHLEKEVALPQESLGLLLVRQLEADPSVFEVADLPNGVDERPSLCADPVRIGCVGESPGDFWEQAVAQVGRRFDLARVERVSLGTDGEAQYVNGASRIPFREVDGWIDPFHVIRAAASCAVDRGVGGSPPSYSKNQVKKTLRDAVR